MGEGAKTAKNAKAALIDKNYGQGPNDEDPCEANS